VKTKMRPEEVSLLEADDWLAGLRDGESAESAEPADPGPAGPAKAEPTGPGPDSPGYAVPASYGHGVPADPGHAVPAGYVRAIAAGPGYAVPAGYVRAGPAADSARPEAPAGPVTPSAPAAAATPARTAVPAGPARPAVAAGPVTPSAPATPARPAVPAGPARPALPAGAAARAVIGDQLRMPVMWCEMGSCVSWYTDPAALGEADTRARAIGAGWRIDALGRLACTQCQQSDPGFWASRPVAVRDRDAALASTVPIAAVPGDGTARGASLPSRRDPRSAGRGNPPASRAEPEWHHDFPADEAHAGRQVSGKAGRYLHSLGVALNPARAWRAGGTG